MSSRTEVFAALISERNYQDHVWRENAGNVEGQPVRTIAEELLMIEEYAARARKVWTDAPRDVEVEATTDMIRKIGAICVRAMENHGAPHRVGF